MAQLRQDHQKFIDAGAVVLVVGPEGKKAFEAYWRKNDLPFTGLPDPRHTVLKRYGQEINLFKLGRMPAQVIIDRAGRARYVHYGKSMSDIPDNETLLQVLRELGRLESGAPRHIREGHRDMSLPETKETA